MDVDNAACQESPLNDLIELYNFLCCIASITCDSVPRPYGSILRLSTACQQTTIHPLFGISTCLYEYLASANRLASRIANGPSLSTLGDLREEAQVIELDLQSWNPPDNANSSRLMAEAQAAAFAMQWATMIRLLQPTRKLKIDHPQIKKAADNILSALSLIRPGSELEAHILFPLFIAGVCSMTKPTRMTVEYRLNIMETTIGFGNIKLAHQLLDEIWRRDNKGEIVDWEDLMRTKYPGLVLL